MRAVVGIAALALTSCTVGPDYHRPDLQLPPTYRNAPPLGSNSTFADSKWWTVYRAPALQALIRDALAHNPDALIAAERVAEAAETLGATQLNDLPSLDARAGATRARPSDNQRSAGQPRIGNGANLGLSVSYELDLWGRLRRLDESARAQWLSAVYNRDAVVAGLVASTASAYFDLVALDEQLAALRESEAAGSRFVELTTVRHDAGAASGLDLATAQSELAAVRAQRSDVERRIAQSENLLATLAGRYPQPVARAPAASAVLAAATLPPAGLPVRLLERRPDLRAAETDLISSNALVGATKADLLPTLSLTGLLGFASPQLSTLLDGGSATWSIGGSLLAPLLQPERNARRVGAAQARARAAAQGYRKAALTALREVADALAERGKQAEILGFAQAQVDARRRARDLALERYRIGYSSYFEVISAQRALSSAQLQLAASRRDLEQAVVKLYLALGGGW